MYLHAFAATRMQFDHYIFSEDDYLPVPPHFDETLVQLYRGTFGSGAAMGVGCLAGVLQGTGCVG